MKYILKIIGIITFIALIILTVSCKNDPDHEHIWSAWSTLNNESHEETRTCPCGAYESNKIIAEKYRFEDGIWRDETNTINGSVTVGITSIITTPDIGTEINLSNIYTFGNGTGNYDGNPFTWVYIYYSNEKIGFAAYYPEDNVRIVLGKTFIDTFYNVSVSFDSMDTSDMNYAFNGEGRLYIY